jgi:hypothetical protein
VIVVTSALALIVSAFVVLVAGKAKQAVPSQGPTALQTTPGSYLGMYTAGVPNSYAGVTAFTSSTGVKLGLVPLLQRVAGAVPDQLRHDRGQARCGAAGSTQPE